jgi:hypothetical protein
VPPFIGGPVYYNLDKLNFIKTIETHVDDRLLDFRQASVVTIVEQKTSPDTANMAKAFWLFRAFGDASLAGL